MKKDQVLDEDEKRKRFSKKIVLDHLENESDENLDDGKEQYVLLEKENDSELDEFWDFDTETSAIDDIKVIHEEISKHSSILDPITGFVKTNDKTEKCDTQPEIELLFKKKVIAADEVEKNISEDSNILVKKANEEETCMKYYHKKFQHKEFNIVDELHHVKKVNIIDQPHSDIKIEVEVEILDDTFDSEPINISFNIRELENLYTFEERNYFIKAVEMFKSFMQGSSSMRASFMHQAVNWSINGPSILPLEFFKYTMNQSR